MLFVGFYAARKRFDVDRKVQSVTAELTQIFWDCVYFFDHQSPRQDARYPGLFSRFSLYI